MTKDTGTTHIPPFTVSAEAINLIAEISAQIERYAIRLEHIEIFGREFGVKFGVKFGVNEKRVLLLLHSNPTFSATEIAEKTGLSKRGIEKQIKKFRDLNVIFREGSDKNGLWVINKG